MLETLLGHGKRVQYPSNFLGEVNGYNLITFRELREAMGLTDGKPGEDVGVWLEFDMDGRKTYVSKGFVTTAISWNNLNEKGLVFGDRILWIDGEGYVIRLIKGANTDPTTVARGYYQTQVRQSEWDALFLGLVRDSEYIPSELVNPFAPYAQEDIPGLNDKLFDTLCQETRAGSTNQCLYRGYNDVTFAAPDINKDRSESYDAYRPLLEHIPNSDTWANIDRLQFTVQDNVISFTAKGFHHIDHIVVYRSNKPFTPDTLPEPRATLNNLSEALYEDEMLSRDQNYYLFQYHSSNGTGNNYFSELFSTSGWFGDTGPGSEYLLAGDRESGYLGRVSASSLITPQALLSQLKFSKGTQYNLDTNWLKFSNKGQIVFLARQPIVHTIPWAELEAKDVIHGNREITVAGRRYKLYLISGVNDLYLTNTYTGYLNSNNHELTPGSEWDRLLLPLVREEKPWDTYTPGQLGVASGAGQGTWGRETLKKTDPMTNYIRGYSDIRNIYCRPPNDTASYANYSYRPMLVLVDGN